ncbi:thiamine pyrophosphate-binding protein [Desulfitobacterium sp. Sab5]|uniref:thiamine pyrophosphate-binding protein n=1 Tax=Desulfitobacterium nosdiversum TaxID=3375356 RepID=UPI003CF13FED
MKVSDYVAKFLTENGINDLFLISGGGIMHLLDSVGKQEGLNLVFNLNEQATGICADSYAQYTNHLGACLVTTGPGATNAVTGCAGAWLDSSPVLYISGQTKTADMGQVKGLRQFGAQEIAIVPMVTPITKYAVTVMKADEIKYHLEKAVYLATHGRRGPVWVDIPLDIQGSQVDLMDMKCFNPESEGLIETYTVETDEISKVYDLLNKAERPVVLLGHGVTASGKGEKLRQLFNEFRIPALVTWRAKGIYGDDDKFFMGSPGIPATRYSNYVLQNSDFLLIIGSRLNPAITAYAEDNFAPNAVKVIVDIDNDEINKLTIPFELKLNMDAGIFIESLVKNKKKFANKQKEDWINYCINIKAKYPLNKEIQPLDNEGKVDGFKFADKLSDYITSNDVIIGSSSGRTCGISHMAIKLKKGQKFITSMGIGSMGWCLPSAIASCVASGRRRTILLEGDGSLQHNIQELALISTYKLPIKLFVYSNSGYASIYVMQKNNFNSNYAGCNKNSGVDFPDMESIARTYNLSYYVIKSAGEIDKILDKVMKDDKPVLCEIEGSINFDEIPKSKTIAHKDGTFSSSKLEYLYPFIDLTEHNENMIR